MLYHRNPPLSGQLHDTTHSQELLHQTCSTSEVAAIDKSDIHNSLSLLCIYDQDSPGNDANWLALYSLKFRPVGGKIFLLLLHCPVCEVEQMRLAVKDLDSRLVFQRAALLYLVSGSYLATRKGLSV